MAKRDEPCPACEVVGAVAVVLLNGVEYALCRECVAKFVAAHARLARQRPRKKT
jgi:hypothetical protein